MTCQRLHFAVNTRENQNRKPGVQACSDGNKSQLNDSRHSMHGDCRHSGDDIYALGMGQVFCMNGAECWCIPSSFLVAFLVCE